MANLSELYIKKEVLQLILDTLNKKSGDDSNGIKITISQDDKSNQFGQNVTAYVAQSKEQRDAKAKKFYIGNGKVFWTKGETPIGTKSDSKNQSSNKSPLDEPPF